GSPAATKAYAQAAEFAWKAAQQYQGAEKKALLLLAGQDALQANNYQQAQQAFAELLTMPLDSRQKPQVLIGLAESLILQKQYRFAVDRLREALVIPGNHEAAARLQLARVLLLLDKNDVEAGKQLEQAAALVIRPESGDEARTACHQWAAYLSSEYFDKPTPQNLRAARGACEKALQFAEMHRFAAQTRYLLAELLLAESKPLVEQVASIGFDLLQEKQQELWKACQFFQQAAEELKQPAAMVMSNEHKDAFIRRALFGQAECWFYLGSVRPILVTNIPSAEVCWQRAAELYQAQVESSSNRVERLYAYWRLSQCQEKRGLFAEMKETLNDAYQQLQSMSDAELELASSRVTRLTRSQWEAYLRPRHLTDRGQP
ncbi:MAG TPA: hypothetical protein PKA06_11895, partial [Gemmatales bacterium]|nr:hypothetical protein [Gemmatales bacterium]